MTKRLFDVAASVLGILVLSPVLVCIALAIWVVDGPPVFFRQERVGLAGRPFRIWKFRTMRPDADRLGPLITRSGDPRVTRIGRSLRSWKLDELPQLFNVAVGEMSLVGPRPEVPRYVAHYTEAQRKVLGLRPGITDAASIEFRDEEAMLAASPDPEKLYVEYCLPRKIELNLRHASSSTIWTDALLIFRTLWVILSQPPQHTSRRQ